MKEIEEWRDIKKFKGIYQVSNLGRIKSLYGWNGHNIIKRDKILKQSIQKLKYDYKRWVIKLNGKTYKVHKLVAEAFIPNPYNYKIVNHKDCNPLNNKVKNLEWCSQKHNIQEAIKNHRNKRYNYFDKDYAISLYKQGYTSKYISDKLNIKTDAIKNLVFKNKLSRKEYPQKSKYCLSIIEIKNLLNKGMSNNEISIMFNIPKEYIARRKYQIKKGEI